MLTLQNYWKAFHSMKNRKYAVRDGTTFMFISSEVDILFLSHSFMVNQAVITLTESKGGIRHLLKTGGQPLYSECSS